MRLWLILWFGTYCSAAGQTTAPGKDAAVQLGSIEGHIIDATTGAPIASVVVKSSAPGTAPALSDESGRYILKHLPPGRHMVYPQKDGYGRPLSAPPRVARLLTGQRLANVDFRLEKEAVLSGRIVDRLKNPAPGARVAIWVKEFPDGQAILMFRGSARTNSAGEYKIGGLRAGEYYVSVLPAMLQPRPATSGNANGERSPEVSDVRVFYPNAFSIDTADPVRIRASETREGIDIRLDRHETYCVRFSVSSPSEFQEATTIDVTILETANLWRNPVADGQVKASEPFEICGVPPASYRLLAVKQGEKGGVSGFISRDFEVGKRDVSLGALSLTQGHQLAGTIVIAGAKPEDPFPAGLVVALEPAERIGAFRNEDTVANVKAPGDFLFKNILSDKYFLRVNGLPTGYYFKSAEIGGAAITGGPFFATGGELRIVLGADGPLVGGQVTDKEGRPIGDSTVILTPRTTERPRHVIKTQSDQNGSFQFLSGLVPGEYLLFAISGPIEQRALDDPSTIDNYSAGAVTLTLAARDQKSVTLTVPNAP